MVRWTIGEVQDGSGDPRGGPGRFGGPSGMSQDGSEDPREGAGRVGKP